MQWRGLLKGKKLNADTGPLSREVYQDSTFAISFTIDDTLADAELKEGIYLAMSGLSYWMHVYVNNLAEC